MMTSQRSRLLAELIDRMKAQGRRPIFGTRILRQRRCKEQERQKANG